MASSLMPMLRMMVSNYPLAKLFSYAAGSTVKQNTYTTKGLAVANSNPLQADANGLFTEIWLDPALSYKFVLSPSTDTDPPTNAIFTEDGVSSGSSQLLTVLSKAIDYAVLSTDGDDVIILVDATTGNKTISVYTAVGNSGRKLRVVKIDNSVNTVTIDPNGAQTWDGLTTRVLSAQWEAATGTSDGANWVEISQAVGFGISTSARWKMTGTFTPTGATGADRVLDVGVTVTLEANANGAGVYVNPTFTEAGSGTHAIIAGLWVPIITVTNAGANVTTAAGIYVAGAPTATGASTWSILVAAGNVRFLGAANDVGTITTGVWNAADVTSSGLLTVNGFGTHAINAGGVGANTLSVRNTTAGVGNYGVLLIGSDSGVTDVGLYALSSTYTTATQFVQSGGVLEAVRAGGLSISAKHASGAIRFYTGATPTLRGTIGSTGVFDYAGDIRPADANGFTMTTWPTTASAANTNVANGNYARLVTSLRANKSDERFISVDDAKRTVMGLRGVLYKSRVDADQRDWAGFIADDAEQINPVLATYDDRGVLQSFTYDRVPAYLVPLAQDHEARLCALEGVRH